MPRAFSFVSSKLPQSVHLKIFGHSLALVRVCAFREPGDLIRLFNLD
jgi:hypothetical protein